jgi:hypothetical protein
MKRYHTLHDYMIFLHITCRIMNKRSKTFETKSSENLELNFWGYLNNGLIIIV